MHRIKWTEEELAVLKKNYYNTPRKELEKLLPNRTWRSIGVQASQQRLNRILETSWSKEELNKLKKVYGSMSKADAVKMFPGRTWQAIKCKAVSLGFFRMVCEKWWTPEQDKILKKIYPKASREEIQTVFPDRTWKAIRNRSIAIGVYRQEIDGLKAYKKEEVELIQSCIKNGIDANTVIESGIIRGRHPDAIKDKFNYEKKRLKGSFL